MEEKKKHKKRLLKSKLKHKTLRKRNIFSLLSIIMIITSIIFIFTMDLLPTKYIYLLSVVLLLIDIIGIILINVHKKIFLKIIGIIILILSIVSSCIGLYYLNSTKIFINDSFSPKSVYVKNTYYVLSHKNSGLKETNITDEISTYKETVHLEEALNKLNDKYTVKEKQYNELGIIFDNINKGIDKFILIEKQSYEIVFQISNNLNKEDYTILYEFDIFTKRKSNENTSTEKFNIYLGATDNVGLRDFNMVISVNTKTHKALLTSIPRDYYIEVADKGGRKDKLSFMSAYGIDSNKESLANLFKTQIDYSVIIDVNNVSPLVDYVGGIEFCSDYAWSNSSVRINKGCQHLDGRETVIVARERNSFPGRDRIRQENCRKILLAIFKKLASTDTILHYNETLNTLSGLYNTDIPKEIVSQFVKDILNNGNTWQIETQSVDGTDVHDKVHLSNMIDWVMYPNKSDVEKATKAIKETLN